ncbi:MAG: YfhO family protein [Atopobiaceae bacterium]|nr:YfhO family protein [Atopobiaceae bacterium]
MFAGSDAKREKNCGRSGSVLGAYTLAFVIVSLIAFLPLLIEGKSFINRIDGLCQQYGTFIDTGATVQGIVADFLAGKGLHVPFYDFSMGYGSVHSWSHDPLQYLSALCPSENTEWLFNLLVVVRLWLAGACALPLLFRLGIRREGAVLAALTYAFSGSGLNCALQIAHLNPMILFPLMVNGALLLLNERRPWWYLFASGGFLFVCGPYLYYAAQLLIAVLTIVILTVRRTSWRGWVRYFALFAACIICSMLMGCDRAADIFRIGTLDRVSVSYANPVLYSADYYQKLFCSFSGAVNGGRDWFYGYGACGLLGAIVLWQGKPDRQALVLRVLFVAGLVFLCVPFIGSLFNGLAYAANRWVFGFALLVACIVGTQAGRLAAMDTKSLAVVAFILLAYSVLVLVMPFEEAIQTHWQMVAAWAVMAFLLLRVGNLSAAVVCATCLAAIGCNWALFFSPTGTDWQDRLLYQGDAYALVATETPAGLATKSDLAAASRTDRSVALAKNVQTPGLLAHRLLDTYGVDYYASVYNNDVDLFHDEMALAFDDLPITYYTLDQRAALMRVLGVGTYVTMAKDKIPLPYGMRDEAVASLERRTGDTYELYEEETPSTLALVYDDAIASSAYEELTPLQKQEALLQGVVLDDEEARNRSLRDPSLTSEEVGFSILELGDGVKLKNGAIEVRKPSSYVRLELERPVKSCEVYLSVNGLVLDALSPREQFSDKEWNALTRDEQKKVLRSEADWTEPQTYKVGIKSNASGSIADVISTPYFHLYGGKDSWLWNAGYYDKGVRRFRITFYDPGIYTFDDFKVLAQPMETYDEATRGFTEQAIQDLQITDDTLRCSVDAHAGQMLFLSIPYDGCWHAKVNGAEVDVHKADTAFMAIDLVEGKNEIEFSFKSRARYMMLVSFVATVVCLAASLRSRGAEDKLAS